MAQIHQPSYTSLHPIPLRNPSYAIRSSSGAKPSELTSSLPTTECSEMRRSISVAGVATLALFSLALFWPRPSRAQIPTVESAPKSVWSPVQFAIVKFNEDAPKSWNMYHTDRKGLLLVRIWKRYLFVDLNDEEVYDIDPRKVNVKGDTVEFSFGDVPDNPIETPEFRSRSIGMLQRVRFRLGKDGHILELQIPLGPTGRSIY
jgi:hypothetical protein